MGREKRTVAAEVTGRRRFVEAAVKHWSRLARHQPIAGCFSRQLPRATLAPFAHAALPLHTHCHPA